MVLVTGGTGFLGSYIISNLVLKGIRVRAIRRSAPMPFWIDPAIISKVEWVEGDLLDPVALAEAMQGVDVVVHSAAVVSFAPSGRRNMYAINVEGTANTVNVALETGVKRFIHISSIAALGRTTTAEMVNEEKKWTHNSNNTHYAITKHHAEMHVWRGFAEGLEGVILNPSTILGYGNWHHSSNTIFKNIYKGFNWYTAGINGFVGVEDVAEAAAGFVHSETTQQRFIVNAGNWTFRQLMNTIAAGFDKPPPSREATPLLTAIAWRLESIQSFFTGKKPLLTKETAKVGQSKTSFDGSALLAALPGFQYAPLETVIQNACEKYRQAVQKGQLSL